MEVKINREIRDYQESIFFGLNLRQLVFSILAIGVAVGIYFGLNNILGTETVSWMCVLGAAPFAAMGFIRYNGMNAEAFIGAYIKSEWLMYDFVELYGVTKWALSTFDAKKGLIDNYINPYIGNIKISALTPRMVDEYYQKLLKVKCVSRNNGKETDECVSPRNVKEIHKILNCAYNQAIRWECADHNPIAKATLPKVEATTREIWTADDLFHALDVCDDERLSLAINLAFSCSLRLGELMALTWDCVVIDEKSIEQNDASIYVNKELQRVSKNSLQKLNDKDVIKVFPAVFTSNNTALVLKKPKTRTSIRKIWLPTTVARMLVEWKAQQEERKEFLGDEYTDYDLVLSLPNGRPLEGQVISRAFKDLIRKNGLPDVVFHSLRHTSTTY